MSVVSPLIVNWIDKGYKWKYIYNPVTRVRPIPRNGDIEIAHYEYPEGSLILLGAFFDNPLCGVRMEADPKVDTERTHSIANFILAGLTAPNVGEFVTIPPTTPAGVFGIHIMKEWPWQSWCKIHIFNSDLAAAHNFLGLGYTMVVIEKDQVRKITT